MIKRSLKVNAWSEGVGRSGAVSKKWIDWALQTHMQRVVPKLAYADAPDVRDWRNPKIGWGILLPENESLSEAERAVPAECPARVQEIVRQRHGVVLRYNAELMPERVSRYYPDHHKQDLKLIGTDSGVAVGELPMYLLILASPAKIPWKHQYIISGTRLVGRLDLAPDALTNYFEHLANDWSGSAAKPLSPLLWSVDWGADDITSLLRNLLANRVHEKYCTDDTLRPTYLHSNAATCSALAETLAKEKPGLIVTTSHGRTGPLKDVAALRSCVGALVDQEEKTVNGVALLRDWEPDGAIWYAHACCSAGTDAETSYTGLFDEHESINRALEGAAKVGSEISPFPKALLSASKPVRAFVGHVEPTFDWPLLDPETGQPLSSAFRDALTTKVYGATRHTIGSAFRGVHSSAAGQFQVWYQAKQEASCATDPETRFFKREMALRAQLAGLDWQSVVILGDPTVTIPTA